MPSTLAEYAGLRRGNLADLARRLSYPTSNVYDWVNGRRPVPRDLCPQISILTGVPLSGLRPDIDWDQAVKELVAARLNG